MSKPKKPAYRTISARVSPEFYARFIQYRDYSEANTQNAIVACLESHMDAWQEWQERCVKHNEK